MGLKIEDLFYEPKDFWEELAEEFEDFIEDFFEHLTKRKKKIHKHRKVKIYGALNAVRPAYAFAERVENTLKVIFGFSILISAIVSSFWGFPRLSILMDKLINNFLGRIIIGIIGFSYFIIGIWKLMHLTSKQ